MNWPKVTTVIEMVCKPNEDCYRYAGMVASMSDNMSTTFEFKPYYGDNGPEQNQYRKRTKFEAAIRAQEQLGDINRTLGTNPFFRPYLVGLNILTYGLILVDPLDRLE